MTEAQEPRQTPLAAEHEALGAAFTDFAGWRMPVRYGSDLAEHAAVREAAGLFDLSHMGEIFVHGADAAGFLDYALAGRLSAVASGRAKYTMILAEDGGVIDDLVVYRLGDDRFLVIANAGNRGAVRDAMAERAGAFRQGPDGAVDVEDVSDDYALIAVQGPAAQAIAERTEGIEALGAPWAEQRGYGWTDASFGGAPLLIARTGYTGEDGFELLIENGMASSLWRALLAAGEGHGLVPAGLGARDTLRLEAGMPLYGHELTRDVVPAQAGLGRVIPEGKTGFVGEAGAEPRPGARVLVGLSLPGRRAARAGAPVLLGGKAVGEVTSGALGPTLGHPIAMAYVDPAAAEASAGPSAQPDRNAPSAGGAPAGELAVDVRGTRIPAVITPMPFYRRKK
ncbi:glycine cleavage system aminomethyltransferase GcvT [Microbacterium halophytorum]|uniref:glycine cleavage system aminomethyltransferase GcvT n=1 Tax=Microbacterium halophytorum TaxID=2067568 RepID=UPI000CFCC565|nr:glycine cleavage system aminomethyltransferase GcvT [Microbacterium halophytorum]